MDVKKLIEETLYALGNNQSLAEVSSKIKIIVRLLGNDELKSWYDCEFVTGYTDKELPDYRKSKAADIRADYLIPHGFGVMHLTGQSVPMANLGIEKYNEVMSIEFKDTIASIIEYKKHSDSISMSLTPYELTLVQKVLGEAQIQNVRKLISPSSLQTIIDNVQNKIIDLFMDLNETVFNGEINMNTKDATQVIRQVINNNITAGIVQTGTGKVDVINSTVASTIENGISHEVRTKLQSLTDQIEAIVKENDEEFDEIAQNIVLIREMISEPHPKLLALKNAFNAISWGASIATKTAIETVVKKAVEMLTVE